MVADRLELVRSALIGMLSVGLSPSVDVDRPCMERLTPISAAFTTSSADLRTRTLCNHANLSSAKARAVMCEMASHDLRLWVNEIMRVALIRQPLVVPPPPDTVFAVPRYRPFGWASAFCQGGGELQNIVEETSRGRVAGDGHSKRKAAAVPFSPGAGHARNKSSQTCNMFATTGRCKWRDCILVHDAPLRIRRLPPPSALEVVASHHRPGRITCFGPARGQRSWGCGWRRGFWGR